MKRQLSQALLGFAFVNVFMNAEFCGCIGQNSFSTFIKSRSCVRAEEVLLVGVVLVVGAVLVVPVISGADGVFLVVVLVESIISEMVFAWR